jgi:uncharacterized protein (TIGR02646 family)
MIYIYVADEQIPNEWREKARRLTDALCAIPDCEERKAFIERHSGVWREIKENLLRMSHGKCWYSEAPDVVSDWHIDHFRPKKIARDLDGTEHEGYHWLAFDWRNFRLCGSFPNSPHRDEVGEVRGKRDLFPLAPGCHRASWDNKDCAGEQPLLLDPTHPNDPSYVTFDEEGQPKPSRPMAPLMATRVQVTTQILYLDSPRLIESRKRVWRDCAGLIEELLEVIDLTLNEMNVRRRAQVARIEQKLRERTMPEAPYAAVARACLRAYQLDYLIALPEAARAA